MSYIALYRKYRPQNFDDVVGQDHIIKALRNQVINNKVAHAYLFCGSRGTGKTTTARIFAKAINCLNPVNGSPCGKCEVCKALSHGEQFDIIEIDAASNNGVDDARALRESVRFLPVIGKKKVFIIDEVHMLSTSAFNALLKTIEEPPEHVVFILGTTEIQKIPSTILSRLMRFDFHLLAVSEIEQIIKKILDNDKVVFENDAVNMVARASEGSVRDALSVLDACLAYNPGNLTVSSVVDVLGIVGRDRILEIIENIIDNNLKSMLLSLDNLLVSGKSPLVMCKELMSCLCDLMVVETLGSSSKNMLQFDDVVFSKYEKIAKKSGKNILLKIIDSLGNLEAELRLSVQPKIVLEMALFKAVNAVNKEENISNNPGSTMTEKKKDDIKDKNYLGQILHFLRKSGKMQLFSAFSEVGSLEKVNDFLVGTGSIITKNIIDSKKAEIFGVLKDLKIKDIIINVEKNKKDLAEVSELKKLFGEAFEEEE